LSAARTKPRRAEKNAATTAALLGAAAETFAARGYEAATMDEIAERVGLSKGALYYRYKTKEDLFLALLDERCSAYLAQLQRPLADGARPEAGWAGLAGYFLEIVREGTWPRLFFEFVSYSSRSPRARRELVKRTRTLRDAMQRLIEDQATQAGTALPIPAADIALAISALGNGLALEYLADPSGVPDHAFVELPGLIIGGVATAAESDGPRVTAGRGGRRRARRPVTE
jgi:AcrR family transcriptional regulator